MPRSVGTLRRAMERWRILRRFAELRRDPAYDRWSKDRLFVLVLPEVCRRFPTMKCSLRTLQRWVQDWNSTKAGGLVRGFLALLDHYGRPPKRR